MILERIADYITELMDFDSSRVLIGRENATVDVFTNDYIVIDNLSPAIPITTVRNFDSKKEVEKFSVLYSAKFTFEFYGENAYSNMYKFLALQNSQKAKDLQKKYILTVFKAYSTNNLKQIVGNKYYERYEVEITIQYWETLEVDTFRIDKVMVNLEDDTSKIDEVMVSKFLKNN